MASVDRWGEDGTEGTLKALPTNGLFRSSPKPHFLTDPVLLDAAGQLVGYWAAEHLETGFHVFPFRVEAVHIYGPNLCQGELREMPAFALALVGEEQVRSDIDVIGPDGRLLTQLAAGGTDALTCQSRFYRLRISPRDGLSEYTLACAHRAIPDARSIQLLPPRRRSLMIFLKRMARFGSAS